MFQAATYQAKYKQFLIPVCAELYYCLDIFYSVFRQHCICSCVGVLSYPYRPLTTSKGSIWVTHVHPSTQVNQCINQEGGWKSLKCTRKAPSVPEAPLTHFQPHNQPTSRQQTPPSNHTKTQATDLPWPQKCHQNFSEASTCPVSSLLTHKGPTMGVATKRPYRQSNPNPTQPQAQKAQSLATVNPTS